MADPSPTSVTTRSRGWAWPTVLGLLAVAVFGVRLSSEPEFPDEWAYVSQAYFADLLAEPDNPRWLEYPAYDLPPLPKYAIRLALEAGGYKPPPPASAFLWYGRSIRTHYGDWYGQSIKTRYGDHAMLVVTRWPSVAFGVLGCLSVYAIGTMAVDRRVGVVSALFLMANPLYRMLARRAMSDIYAEGLVLAALAVGLWAWRGMLSGGRRPWVGVLAYLGAGVLGGLAVLSKLTGGLALMVLAGWALLGLALAGFSWRRRAGVLAATAGTGAVAYATFVALNPFVWSDPAPPLPSPIQAIADQGLVGRTVHVIEHRSTVSRLAQGQFPDDKLDSIVDKVPAVVVQGFGRFGPLGQKRLVEDVYEPERMIRGFDSTIRFDRVQDFGALLWFPLVLAGVMRTFDEGRRQYRTGEVPTAWAILAQGGVTLATITAYIPLAWDRYYLALQAPACLLAAGALVLTADALVQRFRRIRRGEPR